mmetsp:Transcript_4611/g.15210  ORF Transcript_4611/g.15210 Transcript_4611/m.15210 type:complete len:728 (+) Transcript_4611:69-2252(+)
MAVSLLSLGAWAVALVSHLSGGAHASSPPLLGGGGRHRFRSVPEVEGAMYAAIDKETCTLLLHAHGEIGCGTKFRKGIAEPLQSLEAAEDEIHGRRVVLLTYRLLDAFLGRLASDPSAAANVAGILLRAPSEGADGEAVLPESFSPAERAPMAPLAPYANSSYEWNPRGSGLGMRRLPFPLFLVPSSTGAALDALAQDNVARGYRGALHVAEMAVIMHASGAGSSSACLAASGGRGTCEPLGGYSAWAAYPPLPVAPPGGTPETDGKKLVLAVAPMDSAGVFRSRLAGAESPISGLVAMMVAMRALTLLPPAVAPPGRVLFAALAGEPWGLLGSRRLAGDLASGKLPGLHAEDVSAVLELGALGRSGEGGGKAPSLFAHTGRSSDGQPHPGARDVLAALQRAGVAAGSPVAAASAGLPGTPPGPLWSFLRLDPSAPGAVLADFDSSFSSPYFGGELDALGNCTAGGCRGRPSREELTAAVLAAGDVAARALFELAGGDGAAWPHPPGGAEGARALGVSLVECLLDEGEGMGCPLAASLMSPGKEQPDHYVGVLPGWSPAFDPGASHSDYEREVQATARDVPMLLFNVLANSTGAPNTTSTCRWSSDCRSTGEMCVGWRPGQEGSIGGGLGWCVAGSAGYLPAAPLGLAWRKGSWKLLPSGSGGGWTGAEMLFTESNWDAGDGGRGRLYIRESDGADGKVLAAGVGVTALWVLGIYAARAAIERRKRD